MSKNKTGVRAESTGYRGVTSGLTSEAHELSRSSICLFLLQVKHAELKFGVPKNLPSVRDVFSKHANLKVGVLRKLPSVVSVRTHFPSLGAPSLPLKEGVRLLSGRLVLLPRQ